MLFPLFLLLNQPPSPQPTVDESGSAFLDYSIDSDLCLMVTCLFRANPTNQEHKFAEGNVKYERHQPRRNVEKLWLHNYWPFIEKSTL